MIDQILIRKICAPRGSSGKYVWVGDRACISDLLTSRGRVVNETQLLQLVKSKAQAC